MKHQIVQRLALVALLATACALPGCGKGGFKGGPRGGGSAVKAIPPQNIRLCIPDDVVNLPTSYRDTDTDSDKDNK